MGNKVEPVRQEGDKKNSKNTKDDDIVAEVDDDLENGPVFKRKCTDIICCPIFVAFIVGMAWAFIYGLSEGDPIKLTVMFDYDGHGCGYTSGYKNFDYIYWPDIDTSATSFSTLLQKTICVKRCPTIANPLASGDCTDTSIASPCESSGTAYDSKLYLNRFCVPDTSSTSATSTYQSFYDSVMDDWGGNYLTSYMADLYTVWWVCLVCAGLSFLLGFIYMCFIK